MQDSHFNANITLEEDEKNWTFVPAQGERPAHYKYNAPIQKSASDDRDYRIIRLENGLQAVLVHDATTDKAAASLDVGVGHLSDPVSFFTTRSCSLIMPCYAYHYLNCETEIEKSIACD